MMHPLGRAVAVVLFTLTAASGYGQTFQTVHSFAADDSHGSKPWGTLTIGPDRNLYGTAAEGGTGAAGTAFKFSPVSGFTLLGNFVTADTGRVPTARLLNLGDGFLYGATSLGTGTTGDPIGTVFKLDPAATPSDPTGLTKVFALPGSGTTPMIPVALVSGEPEVLHVLGSSPGGIWRVPLGMDAPTPVFGFAPSGDQGLFPQSLIRGSDQNLYGVTSGTSFVDTTPGRQGTIFRIAPNGSGFVTLHDCDFDTGVAPLGAMVEANGTFYGTMSAGGAHGDGVIFKITSAGEYTVIHSVNDHRPTGDLLLASDGRLYGTSSNGGANLYGAVFRVNTNGTGFQLIHSFNKTNGAYPKGGLVQGDDGHLYGTTSEGGAHNKGTIFRIDLKLPLPPVNRAPVAIFDQRSSIGSAVNVAVLANDYDPDGDSLIVTLEEEPEFGTAVVETDGTITYTPTPNLYDGFDSFRYRITDPGGLSSVAQVDISDQASGPVWQPGVYSDILYLDPTFQQNRDVPRAQLVINVSPTGLFTGKLFTQRKRLTVRGLFDQDGVGLGVVTIPRQGKAVIFLADGEGEGLTTLLFGRETWSGNLNPLHHMAPNPAQTFTLLIGADSLLPRGPGFGFMKVFPTGVVAGVGKFSDGTPLKFASTLNRAGSDRQIPVFCEPIKGGVFASSLNEQPGQVYDLAGAARWIRPPVAKSAFPSGFALNATALAFAFTPAPRGAIPLDFGSDQAGSVTIAGIDLPGATGTVTVNGARLVPSAPLQSLSINRNTGIFTGKIKAQTPVGVKSVPFRGAVLQSLQRGEGFYIYRNLPGFVVLEGVPPQ